MSYDCLQKDDNIFLTDMCGILNKHAPLKQEYVKANQAGFIYTELNHAMCCGQNFEINV